MQAVLHQIMWVAYCCMLSDNLDTHSSSHGEPFYIKNTNTRIGF